MHSCGSKFSLLFNILTNCYHNITGETDWSWIDDDMFRFATSPKVRETLTCEDCLSEQHLASRCPYAFPLLGTRNSRSTTLPAGISGGGGVRASGIISPRRNEGIERALVNPEKSAQIPSEGLQMKFVFG